jgi:hypothetical protein
LESTLEGEELKGFIERLEEKIAKKKNEGGTRSTRALRQPVVARPARAQLGAAKKTASKVNAQETQRTAEKDSGALAKRLGYYTHDPNAAWSESFEDDGKRYPPSQLKRLIKKAEKDIENAKKRKRRRTRAAARSTRALTARRRRHGTRKTRRHH